MIIKSWQPHQVVDEPDIEFNRVEANMQEIKDKTPWINWPNMSFKTDRDITHVFYQYELQNIEDNCEVMSLEFEIQYTKRTWGPTSIINYDDLNRWELFINNANDYVESLQLVFTGTFYAGEDGLI